MNGPTGRCFVSPLIYLDVKSPWEIKTPVPRVACVTDYSPRGQSSSTYRLSYGFEINLELIYTSKLFN